SVMQNHVLPSFGKTAIGEISKFDLQVHLNSLAQNYSKSVVGKVRTWVKAVLAEAVEQGYIEQNPAQKLKMPTAAEPCTRFLTKAEIARLLCGLEGRDRLIVRLFIVCGFRPGELFVLRWRVIDDGVSIRVEEAIARGEKGRKIGEPKTRASKKPVALPRS